MVDFKVEDFLENDLVIVNNLEKFRAFPKYKRLSTLNGCSSFDFSYIDSDLSNTGGFGSKWDIKEIYRNEKLIWSRECGLVRTTFAKEDFKFGDIVTLRNGNKTISLNDGSLELIEKDGLKFYNYKVDLTHETNSHNDIMKVHRDGKLIYERVEESSEVKELRLQLEQKEALLKEVSKTIDEIKAKLK